MGTQSDDSMTRHEHEAIEKRIEVEMERLADEDKRQNRRLDKLEASMGEVNKISISVEKMAVNMQSMLEELKKQRNDIEDMKSRDGEMWRKIVAYVVTAVAGILIGYIFKQLGF